MSSLKMFKNEIADQIFLNAIDLRTWEKPFQLSDTIWLKRNL